MKSRPGSLLSIAIIGVLLSACASTAALHQSPPAEGPASVQNPNAATPADVQEEWWRGFNDPLMSELIGETLTANPDIQTAQANLRAARAQRIIAGAGLLPSLNGGISGQRTSGEDSYSGSLDAGWELDIFGGKRSARDAATVDVLASEASLENVQVSLAAGVASAYVSLRLAQASLDVSHQTLAARAETTQLTEFKRQAGLVSELDAEQARLSLGQTRAQIPALENTINQARHALEILTGSQPGELQDRLQQAKPIPATPATLGEDIPAEAIRQRPDIRAAEYAITAARRRVDQARANRFPGFKLGGSLSVASASLSDLFDSAHLVRLLLASISAPLFDGGVLKQQVEVQDAALEQALAGYRNTLLGALRDVANALSSLRSSRLQIPLLEQNVAFARNAEQLALLSYEAGTTDFQNVLDAQRTLLSARDSLLVAQAEQTQATISLYKAIGGAWQEKAE